MRPSENRLKYVLADLDLSPRCTTSQVVSLPIYAWMDFLVDITTLVKCLCFSVRFPPSSSLTRSDIKSVSMSGVGSPPYISMYSSFISRRLFFSFKEESCNANIRYVFCQAIIFKSLPGVFSKSMQISVWFFLFSFFDPIVSSRYLRFQFLNSSLASSSTSADL